MNNIEVDTSFQEVKDFLESRDLGEEENEKETKLKALMTSFSFIWGWIICFMNIYTLFSSIFWLSADGFPEAGALAVEVLLEIIFAIDLLVKIRWRNIKHRSLYFLHKYSFKSVWDGISFISFLLSSFPIVILLLIIKRFNDFNIDDGNYSLFMAFKVFRVWDLSLFFTKVQRLLIFTNFSSILIFKLAQSFFIMVIITHVSSSSWLLINKFGKNNPKSYFIRTNQDHTDLIEQYILSLEWAVSTMNGLCYGNVSGITGTEITISVIVMMVGASFYAKVFSDFETIIRLSRKDKLERRNKFEQAKEFCVKRRIPIPMRKKIKQYYNTHVEGLIDEKYHPLFLDLPTSLQTEISLYLNQDMIKKTELFNLGSPVFILAICKQLHPKICMEGDTIIRIGEIADSFFFLKKGRVEIITDDHQTRIAVLEEGAYFGEVGLMITGTRTVSVKAMTPCALAVLYKKEFEEIMQLFPDQEIFLRKVAMQRMKTTRLRDLLDHDIQDSENSKSDAEGDYHKKEKSDSPKFQALEQEDLLQSQEESTYSELGSVIERDFYTSTISNITKEFNEGLTNIIEKLISRNFLINPFSNLVWAFIFYSAFTYNYLYVTFSICFAFHMEGPLIVLDILCILIYFIDIFVHSYTASVAKNKIKRELVIRESIMNRESLENLLASLPLDYLFLLLNLSDSYRAWIRILRLVKIVRILNHFDFMIKYTDKRLLFYRLYILGYIYILIIHTTGTIMYAISQYEYTTGHPDKNLIKNLDDNILIHSEVPFVNKNIFEIYLNFIYWSATTSTSGPYGDIFAITKLERCFQVFVVLVFKIFTSFLAAEVTNIAGSYKSGLSNHLRKLIMIKKWMNHTKYPKELIDRVLKYHECLWRKFKGIDEQAILDELPDSIRNELLIHMLRGVVEKIRYFPKNNDGIILSILKRLKIIILSKDEYIFKKGEIAAEMYFIIDGRAGVLGADSKVLFSLKKADYFGEMGIIGGGASIRTASVKALTNISLAIFGIKDFNFICTQYPEILERIQKIAQERKIINEKTLNHEKGQEAVLVQIKPDESLKQIGNAENSEGDKKITEGLIENFTKEAFEAYKDREEETGLILQATKDKEMEIKKSQDTSELIFHHKQSFDNLMEELEGPKEEQKLKSINSSEAEIQTQDNPKDIKNYQNYQKKKSFNPFVVKNSDQESFILKSELSDKMPSNNRNSMEIEAHQTLSIIMKTRLEKIKELLINIWNWATIVFKGRSAVSTMAKYRVSGLSFFVYLIIIYNWIFVPFYLAFEDIYYEGVILALEIISVIILSIQFLFRLYRSLKNIANVVKNIENASKILAFLQKIIPKSPSIIYNILLIIPFGVILERVCSENAHRKNFFLIALQLLRLTWFETFYWIFNLMKRKTWALANIIQIIYSYFMFSHLVSCLFIVLGKTADTVGESWFINIPSPFGNPNKTVVDDSKETIYIHALYWSYVTTSHIGIGDVYPINWKEKLYTFFVVLASMFLYLFFFGNITSLISELAPILRSNMLRSYKKVMLTINTLGLDIKHGKVEDYFNYIWKNNKGVSENQMLANVPSGLKCEILYERYKDAWTNSSLFKLDQNTDIPLLFSFLKEMVCEIYMPEDILVLGGQTFDELNILMEGQAEILNFDLKSSIILNPGDYYGCVNPGTKYHCHIQAKRVCKVGKISMEYFIMMSQAYPQWKQKLEKDFNRNIKLILHDLEYFRQLDVENLVYELEVSEDLIKFYTKHLKVFDMNFEKANKEESSGSFEKQQVKSKRIIPSELIPMEKKNKLNINFRASFRAKDTLLNRKIISRIKSISKAVLINGLFINPNSEIKLMADFVHLLMILYTVIALPIYVGFGIGNETTVVVLEIFVSVEAVIYIFIEIKTAILHENYVITSLKDRVLFYINDQFVFDLLGVLPLNLIFASLEDDTNRVFFSIARIARCLQILRMNKLLNKIESSHRQLISLTSFFKNTLLISLSAHWVSCFWFWFNLVQKNESITWMVYTNLMNENLFIRYINSVQFVLSIATSTGFYEQITYNDNEKIVFILFVYIGDALFAMGFGLMASTSELFPESFLDIFDNIKKINTVLDQASIQSSLKQRIEQYFAFLLNLRNRNYNYLTGLKEELPTYIYNDLVYSQTRPFLLKLPIFQSELKFSYLLREIALLLKQAIFLPGDYIIYKDDLGDEMYFIIEGKVNALSANESSVIATLGKGNYFGEIALFMPNARRICSVVAVNFCQLFILKKSDMKTISERFPILEEEFKKEGIRRLKEFRKKQQDEQGDGNESEERKIEKDAAEKKTEQELIAQMNDGDHSDRKETIEDIPIGNESDIESLIYESEAYKIGPRATLALDKKKLKEILKSFEDEEVQEANRESEEERKTDKTPMSMTKKSVSGFNRSPKGREVTLFGNQKKLRKYPMTFYREGFYSDKGIDYGAYNEFVEPDELNIDIPTNKPSRRFKCRNNRERRYSRITLGQELILSRFSGLRLQWGIN